MTRLNSELPLRWRVQHAYDMRTGTSWRGPSNLDWVFPEKVKAIYLEADSLRVVEQEVISREGNTKYIHSSENTITDPRERAKLIKAIEEGIREAKPRRVPMLFSSDYYIYAEKGGKKFKIEISFEGYDIKIRQSAYENRVAMFDGDKNLPLLRSLARKKLVKPDS